MFTDFITNMINSLSELLYNHILIILLLGRESSLRSKQNSYRSVCLSNLSALSHSRAAIRTDFLPFRLLWYQPLPESEQETSPESQQRSVLADQAQCSGCGLRLFSESASAFIESTLAQIYKHKAKDGSSYGGPAYYIQAALKKRWIGVLFAVVLILTYMGGFNLVASFNIADSFRVYSFFNPEWTPLIVGAILAVVFALAVFGGSKKISQITEVLVPIMGIFYLAVSLFIILKHYQLVPVMFHKHFQ